MGDEDRMRAPHLLSLLSLAFQVEGFPPRPLSSLREGQPWKHRLAQGREKLDPWLHARFHTDSFSDSFNRMREVAMNRRGRKVRDLEEGSLSLSKAVPWQAKSWETGQCR